MPSNKRQKELARRRAERQAARRAAERAARRRKRTVLGLTVGGVALAAVLALVFVMTRGDDKKDELAAEPTPPATPTAPATPAPVACGAKEPPPPSKQSFDKEPPLTIDKAKSYTANLKTSCGPISFSMDAAKAPRTVNSLTFLAGKKFYDGTICHRMTATPGLAVLQCGDPEGTGGGGPGYSIAEENLTGATYKRGTVAMAKAQAPGSTGSQFFLVVKDSQLPPEYTVVGQMTPDSLKVLDKIHALGIAGGAEDGAPTARVYLESFTVAVK